MFRRDTVLSRYPTPSTDESGLKSQPAWHSRKGKLCLAIGFSGLSFTIIIASGLFHNGPTDTATQFLEKHPQFFPSSVETFVRTAQDIDVGGTFDYRPLAALCANTTWRDGLVFRLADSTGGGMGNVKNAFLNSVRFAIEAGGESAASGIPTTANLNLADVWIASYVMPRMFHRDPCNVKVTHTGNLRDFSYLFDRAHFKSSLKAACPMMTIYDGFDDQEQYSWTADSKHLNPNSLDDIVHGYWLLHPYEWRSRFDVWVETEVGSPSAEQPVLITLDHAFLLWPILSDPPALVRTFGRVLRSPPRMRRLAARVLHALSTTYGLSLNPRVGLHSSSYFGVHLRTAADAAAVGWTGYEEQASACLNEASAANFSLIYAASGDPDHLAQLTRDAWEQHGIVVTTKSELLHGEDLEELKSMSWDQQALVDYEIMLKSSVFAGLQPSSFSYSIAVKRHSALMSQRVEEWWKDEDLDPNHRPWWSEKGPSSASDGSPHDSLSSLLGDRPAGYLFESTIWP